VLNSQSPDFVHGDITIQFDIEHGVVIGGASGEDQVWIKTTEGEERCLTYRFEDFQLRKGQEVSVIYAGSPDRDGMWAAYLRNHDLARGFVLKSADELFDKLVKPLKVSWLIAIILSIPAGLMTLSFGNGSVGWLLPIAYWFWVGARDNKRRKRVVPILEHYVEQLDTRAAVKRSVARALSRQW